MINFPWPPPPPVDLPHDAIFDLDMFADLVLDGVTSGADSTLWDAEDQDDNDDGVVGTSTSDQGSTEGVTSGNDGGVNGDVKSSERKHKQDQQQPN